MSSFYMYEIEIKGILLEAKLDYQGLSSTLPDECSKYTNHA